MKTLFVEHPAQVNQTYWQHLVFAATVGRLCLCAGSAALIHAFLPFLFQTKASQILDQIQKMFHHRHDDIEKS